MIAVDTNILVYSHRHDSPLHRVSRDAVRRLIEGDEEWAITWPSLQEFYGIVTRARVYKPPTTRDGALGQIEFWLGAPNLRVLHESPTHWKTLSTLIRAGDVTGAAVHDARIAAICLDAGVSELWSADRDFSRFPQLRVVNPLRRV